jgi:putative nucleotidyltransferase with HDIG domain
MRLSPVTWYVTAICFAALVMAFFQDWSLLVDLSARDYWGFATLILLGLAAEQQALSIKVGGDAHGHSIAFLPLLTIVLLFGPAPGVLFWIIGGPIAEYLIRRKPAIRSNFNIGQYVLSTAIAGRAFDFFNGQALMALDSRARSGAILEQLGPFVLFGVVFLVVNNTSVAGVIAISQKVSFQRTWRDLVGISGANVLLDLLIAPIAIAVAALYIQIGAIGLLLSILPLFFIRSSYQTQQKLSLANSDLLKALVKAIETRDPYTSGHSVRVSYLAKRVSEELGLADTRVERIETAALLHDIGKIEAVYSEILRKPDSLTTEERAIIESHVTRGEQLLKDLSSVPTEVVKAVRHHHEREDGRGYPDGLLGDEIPIGAKIIVACDSIDAMLSDRPYRKALPVPVVREQLRKHAGQQFDHRVVRAVLQSDLLSDYEEVMALSQQGVTPDLAARTAVRPLRTSHLAVARKRGDLAAS